MREHPTPALRKVGRKPIEKAAQLVSENRVRHLGDVDVYLVAGDSDNYQVIASSGGIFCPCEARTPLCSHVLAVAQIRARDLADNHGVAVGAVA